MKTMTIIAQPKDDTYKFDAKAALDGFSKSTEGLLANVEGKKTLHKNICQIPAGIGLSLLPSWKYQAHEQGVRLTVLLTDDEPVLADFP